MKATEVPEQYTFLFRFLRECSQAYTDRIEKVAADSGAEWNPRTARFEVDTYFVFLLSASLLGHEHDREGWEDMLHLCETALMEIHREQVSSDDLLAVFVARVKDYGLIQNRCAESGDAPTADLIKSLRQHLMASSHDDRIQAEHPIVIGDAFRELALFFEFLRIDLFLAGAFSCGLKHILQRSNDVRTLPEEELITLAQAGQKEAAAIANRTLASMAAESPAPPRRWWRFWR